jgi:hypothetical protein
MEAICSSETSVETQRTKRRYIPEDGTLHKYRRENLKSYIVFLYREATHKSWRWRRYVPPKRRLALNRLYDRCENLKSYIVFLYGDATHNPWRWRRYVPPKSRMKLNGLHVVIYQKMVHFVTTAVKTSNPTNEISIISFLMHPHSKDWYNKGRHYSKYARLLEKYTYIHTLEKCTFVLVPEVLVFRERCGCK